MPDKESDICISNYNYYENSGTSQKPMLQVGAVYIQLEIWFVSLITHVVFSFYKLPRIYFLTRVVWEDQSN